MSKIIQRYAGAIQGGTLKSEPDTTFSNADVLGAAGFAGKRVRAQDTVEYARPGAPLAMALMRMFTGGDTEARQVSRLMARMLVGKAYRIGDELGEASADLIAGLVLHWHRDSVCKSCGGHGYMVASGTLGEGRAVIGDVACRACAGSRKRPFDDLFPPDRLPLARWLRDEVERETAKAGVLAMQALAPRLDLC